MGRWSLQQRIPVEHQIDTRFYTINHLLSVVKVWLKPFQDLSSKTKAIAQSIQEKSVIYGADEYKPAFVVLNPSI